MPELSEEPRDARGNWGADQATEVLYRLGLSCAAVPGLPDELSVGDVRIAFVRGPVRTQITEIRQRFGLPVVFDKAMRRVEVGKGELIALFSIATAPVPENLREGFAAWRTRALAAAGMVAAVLDERVAGPELLEDAILFREGTYVGAADARENVRTYLPFEVNAGDRQTLECLKDLTASESSTVARAARLYRRAALEGPTADSYATLWVAAECFSEHRTPSRKDIEAALSEAGINPRGLPISVSHLIDLRGKIQHHGLESDDRLTTAFYEMEAVVRTLIRQEAGLRGGWWPASDNPAGFTTPFDAAVFHMHGQGTSHWHTDRLPSAEAPSPLQLPRRTPNPEADPRVDLSPGFGQVEPLIATIVLDAIEWTDPNMTLQVTLGTPPNVPASLATGANANFLWLSEESIDGAEDPDNPGVLVNLVWDLVALVGFALAQRRGIRSRGEGVAVVQGYGSWLQYTRLVVYGEYSPDFLSIPGGHDPVSVGKLSGWAAAGDARATSSVEDLEGRAYELARSTVKELQELQLAAPTYLLGQASS